MIKQFLILSILALSAAAQGMPGDFKKITVLEDQHLRGEHTIRIKRAVRQQLQNEGLRLRDFQLEGVVLRAKSRRGRGQATLRIGFDQSSRTVPQATRIGAFESDRPRTFNRLEWDLQNQTGQNGERWQMQFNGNIKVKKLNVFLSPRTQRITIPMSHQLFPGNNTIRIKRALRDMGYFPREMTLKRVVLEAKSRRGRGTAELITDSGPHAIRTVREAAFGYGFQSNNIDSYNSIQWRTNNTGRGPWQIELNGRIKVRSVTVEVTQNRGGGQGPSRF